MSAALSTATPAKADVYVPPAGLSAASRATYAPNPKPITPHVAATSAPSAGFDWGSAGIGAALVVGALLIGLGGAAELWIGGAIQDWFTFGLGYGRGQMTGNALRASSTVYLFRIETYPFFYSGTFGRDFGLQADFGIGTVTINNQEAEQEMADGGAMSVVGLGAAYEWLHFGSFAAGPTLQYSHRFSESLAAHTAALGMRLVYRSGP